MRSHTFAALLLPLFAAALVPPARRASRPGGVAAPRRTVGGALA
eukprot:CAMPEP_0119263784 /NCGR_PEP_ID=MMETSP1329-20130426/3089_1 /TAXON_ID=114041 /ORGANISM="Genus nov. species nov., Strain RCC1024" /LENGTH=43 /DNA_ID= /DNA_START= /DNA_END= /DNA_ORIENTATION=